MTQVQPQPPSPEQAQALDAVAAVLARAQRILFVTGAGISVDSGLPTYRGIGGLYHERLTDEGLMIEEALSGEMMSRRPDISWKYIAQIEANCRGAQPNIGHRILVDLRKLDDVLPVVLHHHESWDGHGYPRRLPAEHARRTRRARTASAQRSGAVRPAASCDWSW